MEQEKFYQIISDDSDTKAPEYLDKFKYLGSFSIQPDVLRKTTPDGINTHLEKTYLICVEQGALILRVSKMEEVFEFLSLKNWYKETDTQFFMLQLNIEHWVWNNEKMNSYIEEGIDPNDWIDENPILYIEEGIHPLDFEEESEKILNSLSNTWNFLK